MATNKKTATTKKTVAKKVPNAADKAWATRRKNAKKTTKKK